MIHPFHQPMNCLTKWTNRAIKFIWLLMSECSSINEWLMGYSVRYVSLHSLILFSFGLFIWMHFNSINSGNEIDWRNQLSGKGRINWELNCVLYLPAVISSIPFQKWRSEEKNAMIDSLAEWMEWVIAFAILHQFIQFNLMVWIKRMH